MSSLLGSPRFKRVGASVFFFGANFLLYLDTKILEILKKMCLSSVILTNFAIYGLNLAKILTSQK